MRSPHHQLTSVGGSFWLHVLLCPNMGGCPKIVISAFVLHSNGKCAAKFLPKFGSMMKNDDEWWFVSWFFSWHFHDYRTYKFDHLFPSSYARCRAEILLRSHGRGGALQRGDPQPGTRRWRGQWRVQRWVLDVGLTYVAYHGLTYGLICDMWYVIRCLTQLFDGLRI